MSFFKAAHDSGVSNLMVFDNFVFVGCNGHTEEFDMCHCGEGCETQMLFDFANQNIPSGHEKLDEY